MEKEQLIEAVEDLSFIKSVIEKTRKSFSGLSQIFISWGVLFTIYSLINNMQTMNLEKTIQFYDKYPYLMFALPLGIAAIAFGLYRFTVKKKELHGLEKQVLLLWVLILLLCSIPSKVEILNTDINLSNISISTNNFSTVAFGLAIALILTNVFTGLKHLKYLGFIYIALSFLYGYFYIPIVYTFVSSFSYVILPFTFIATGIYLKKQHERSVSDGYQLDS